MSQTSYSPTTVTRSTTDGGFVVSSTFVLEPQTTPFKQPSSCSSSALNIFCDSSMTPGGGCLEVDTMDTDTFTLQKSDCYPEEYTNVYNFKLIGADITTAAYPGNECISGWTTACSGTVIGDDSSAYVQTLCCPQGGYTCDMGQWTLRECVSFLSTPTNIWVSNTSSTYGFETTQFAGLSDDEEPIWVWRSAFPLAGVEARTTTTSGSTSSSGIASTPGSPDSNASSTSQSSSSESEKAPLSMGGLVGVVIGVVACLALLAGLGFWLFRRRRASSRPPQYQYENTTGNGSAAEFDQKSPAYSGAYYKAELPTQGVEVSELPANYGPADPKEMDGQTYTQPRYELA